MLECYKSGDHEKRQMVIQNSPIHKNQGFFCDILQCNEYAACSALSHAWNTCHLPYFKDWKKGNH